ncbi:MAG TPA: PKD domain-containing protein, partial [Thermoplasmata archaeon]|nr:PKD domain-containing protein [Thermoplasmata archaeon]
GTGPVVSHRYPALGTFQLTATVTDSLGATASSTVAITVAGVILTISLNRTSGDAPFAVSAAASVLGGTGTYNPVQWSWGDGTTSTGNPSNHTYASTVVGSVMIQGTTSDSAGQRANATASVKIAPAPLANLSALVPSAASPPVSVDFMLTVSGGTGNFTPLPLWSFGDGTSTRAANPTNHTYQLPGHYHVTVQTNDSLGAIAIGNAWVNLSTGGLAGGIGVGGGGGGQWVFTGVDNPDQAALALMGLVAISGLALLYRTQQTRSAAKAGAKAARPSPPSVRPGVRPVASGVRAPVRPVGAVQSTRPAGAGAPTPVRTWSPPPPPAAPPPPPVW